MDTKNLQCLNPLTPFFFFINLATIQSPLFIYCSWTLFLDTPPWLNLCYVYVSLKTPPKNPVGKKSRRKEYITRIAYAAPVASLKKTLHEKTQWEKLIKEKRVQQLMFRSVFRTDS